MKRILIRYIIMIIIIAIYLISAICFPTSIIGLGTAINSISNYSQINYPVWSDYLFESIISTMSRFITSISFVVFISLLLIYLLHRWRWSLALLDHFSESLRTIPATAWAYPLAILPFLSFGTSWAFYSAIILSTAPILTLGLYKNYCAVQESSSFKLAINNGVKKNKVIKSKFFFWIAIKSIVQFKTTIALIFIIIIVLEDVLQGGSINNGLGVMIGNLKGEKNFSAELLMLVLLSFISITIASLIDIVELLLKGRSK